MPLRPPVYKPPGAKPREQRRAGRSAEGKQRQALYTSSRWRKARARFLAEHPLCRYCEREGRVTAANVVDHIIPHKGDERLIWDRANWQPLCGPCHNGRKQSEERGTAPIATAPNGLPVDPDHPWNRD